MVVCVAGEKRTPHVTLLHLLLGIDDLRAIQLEALQRMSAIGRFVQPHTP